MSTVVPIRRKQSSYYGTCPTCHRTDGYLNVGRDHWFICDRHGVKWYAGSNLFDGWRNESQNTWDENFSKLETYRWVEPSQWEWISGACA